MGILPLNFVRDALLGLLHSVEGLLEQREVARLAKFFPRAVDPLFFQRILVGRSLW